MCLSEGKFVKNRNFKNIFSISNVDESKMEYSLQLTLRETWSDNRLAYGKDHVNPYKYMVLGAEQDFWRPDTFIYVL